MWLLGGLQGCRGSFMPCKIQILELCKAEFCRVYRIPIFQKGFYEGSRNKVASESEV